MAAAGLDPQGAAAATAAPINRRAEGQHAAMTTAAARHSRTTTARTSDPMRRRLHDWMDDDHLVSHAVLVPSSLAGLIGLLGLGYALLFL